jgi:hypothetical protein
VAYNFETGNNKRKLLMEYESVIQKSYSVAKLNFLSYTFIFRKQFSFVDSVFKMIGHETPDNNLESVCMLTYRLRMAAHCAQHRYRFYFPY